MPARGSRRGGRGIQHPPNAVDSRLLDKGASLKVVQKAPEQRQLCTAGDICSRLTPAISRRVESATDRAWWGRWTEARCQLGQNRRSPLAVNHHRGLQFGLLEPTLLGCLTGHDPVTSGSTDRRSAD